MDWNVVVCVYQDGFGRALRALRGFGPVERSPYYNVLVMKAEDPMAVLEAMEKQTAENPALYDAISRIAPAATCFTFDSAEDFKRKAKSTVLEWVPRLAGRSFHVRLHRRGGGDLLRTLDIERFLDDALLGAGTEASAPGKISFSDPDVVIAIDTVDNRAGIALWTREDLARYHVLRPE